MAYCREFQAESMRPAQFTVFLVAAFGPRVCELTFSCAELCGVVHGCAIGETDVRRRGAILVGVDEVQFCFVFGVVHLGGSLWVVCCLSRRPRQSDQRQSCDCNPYGGECPIKWRAGAVIFNHWRGAGAPPLVFIFKEPDANHDEASDDANREEFHVCSPLRPMLC